VEALVRESIAFPDMDFQKSPVIHMDIHDFFMSVLNYPVINYYMEGRISIQGHSTMNIRGT